MTPEDIQRHKDELVERFRQQLDAGWPAPGTDINDLEDFGARLGRTIQEEISERVLPAEAERKDGNQVGCPCGGRASYQRHHELTLVTLAGRVRVRRPYYHCAACKKGQCPADTRLRLGAGHTTPAAQAQLALLSALVPYGQVGDLLSPLGLPLTLDLKQTERVAQGVGKQLQDASLVPYGPTTQTVAVGFDGVMLPTREGKKEARVGVIYEPDREAGRTQAAAGGLRTEYCATTGSRASLVREVCARASARAGGQVVAVVADGAALDWVDLDAYLPSRVEILDFYHVLERVGEIAPLLHPEAAAAAAWREAMRGELEDWGPRKLLETLREWAPTTAAGHEMRRVQLGYFEKQQDRMRYPEYRRRGFPIGSGAVEGACKHVVCERFGRSGMYWKRETAEPVLRLRAALLTQPRLDLRPFAALKGTAAPL